MLVADLGLLDSMQMSDVVVILCGGPEVSVASTPLGLDVPPRRRAIPALAYLVLSRGRPIPAAELAEVVWPDGPPDSWSAGLRRLLTDVRSWLRSGGIDAEVRSVHGAYQLRLPAGVSNDVEDALLDLERARQAVLGGAHADAAAASRRAVARWHASFLPGHDAPWIDQQRRLLESARLEALEVLAEAELELGNTDAALAAAESAIALDDLRESAYRLAMAAHRRAGRIGAALRQYEACRVHLAEELGATPSPATTTAYHALLDVRLAPEPRPEPDGLGSLASSVVEMERRQAMASLEARLATIDAAPHPDPLERLRTLIELGRLRWRVEGNTEVLRRTSLAAGEAALAVRAARELGDALALASTTTGIGQSDPDARDLCVRSRAAFPEDPVVEIRAVGLLAELEFGVDSIALADEAVGAARRFGDDALLLDMLFVLDQSLAWTPDIDRRIAVEQECNDLLAVVPPGWRRRPTFEVMTRVQAADVDWLDAEAARLPDPGVESPWWELRMHVTSLRAVRAKLAGDLAEASVHADRLLRDSRYEINAMHAAGGLTMVLTREMGGVDGILPAVEEIARSNPRISAFEGALALGRSITGDDAGARTVIERLAARGFGTIDRDHVYLLYLACLAESIALLDAADHVPALLDLLEPYAGQLCIGAHGVVAMNAADSYRGMLATVTGHPAGPAWFDAGMAVEDRVGAVLFRARTAAWKAAWLRRHGSGPGSADAAEADRLVAEAIAVADGADDRAGLRAMIDRLGTRP